MQKQKAKFPVRERKRKTTGHNVGYEEYPQCKQLAVASPQPQIRFGERVSKGTTETTVTNCRFL